MIARWNRPVASGIASSVDTFRPPPDSPKMVTAAGSPPKRAMLSRTHASAWMMSSMPALPASANASATRSPSSRWPKTLSRWLIVTTTTSPRFARFTPS